MAEPTCVIHPFSYTTPPFSNETHEVKNSMLETGESVSFGRYTSEELEWEKWSSFNNNNNKSRYVEEAKKYSKAGSVAQKKAYFEAHFKRMAALKAAALLEQQQSKVTCVENNDQCDDDHANVIVFQDDHLFIVDDDAMKLSTNLQVDENDKKERQKNDFSGDFVVHQNQLFNKEEGILLLDENEVCLMDMKSDKCGVSNEESSGIPEIEEKTYVKEEVIAAVTKKNPPLSSYISSGVDGRSTALPSPAKSGNLIHPGKENYATPIKNKASVVSSDPDKKRTPLRMSINREFNRIMSPVIKKLGSSSKAPNDMSSKTPAKASVNCVLQRPPMTPELTKRGAPTSPSTGRNKISSPIIPNSFCLKSGDRTSRRKQKLEEKFNATATETAAQPSKFKEKAEAELSKFRQSFCFKTMSSPDYYRDDGTFRSPNHKNESTHGTSPRGGRLPNRTTSQSKSVLPPRRPLVKQIGLKSKKPTLVPS